MIGGVGVLKKFCLRCHVQVFEVQFPSFLTCGQNFVRDLSVQRDFPKVTRAAAVIAVCPATPLLVPLSSHFYVHEEGVVCLGN